MGNLLPQPVTEKETHTGATNDGLKYGISHMQGWRIHMEDAHVCESELSTAEFTDNEKTKKILLEGTSLFAVFDGHGGSHAAIYCADHIVKIITRQAKFIQYAQLLESSKNGSIGTSTEGGNVGNYENGNDMETEAATPEEKQAQIDRDLLDLMEQALCDAFLEMDKELYKTTQDTDDGSSNPHLNDESGTTAVVVVLTPRWIICANAGDSRAVYSKNGGRAVPLSYDHKPDDEEEERRIKEAGGYVSCGRVDGDLAVSRGFGDYRFKLSTHLPQVDQRVSPYPDIIVQNRNKDSDEFLVLACDGIWDVNSNKDCVDIIHEIIGEGENDFGMICEELIDISLIKGSKDNMTSVIVQLPALIIGTGGGVIARREKLEAEFKSLNEEANNSSTEESQKAESDDDINDEQ